MYILPFIPCAEAQSVCVCSVTYLTAPPCEYNHITLLLSLGCDAAMASYPAQTLCLRAFWSRNGLDVLMPVAEHSLYVFTSTVYVYAYQA